MGIKDANIIKKAIFFRQKGYSLREISERLQISKSTASLWLRRIKISAKGRKRLLNLNKKGLEKANKIRRIKKSKFQMELNKTARKVVGNIKFSKSNFKLFLALLYWCEGSKKERRIVFMNSDPEMVKTFLFLMRKSYKINEKKFTGFLHLHSYHNKEKMINFWSKLTKIDKKKISVYNKKHTGLRRKIGYKGCLSVRYGDVRILDEFFSIIKEFFRIIK